MPHLFAELDNSSDALVSENRGVLNRKEKPAFYDVPVGPATSGAAKEFTQCVVLAGLGVWYLLDYERAGFLNDRCFYRSPPGPW